MNNIKTYLNNLTKADIENATKEELALIIDYMEQVKGDLDFSALIKNKVEQFKQFATEANNKIILEAALQEQQEKQELLRERVRFMRNLDYIEKTVQVQNTREEDGSRIQRNIERQQQQNNIQMQVATLNALINTSISKMYETFNSREYQEILTEINKYYDKHPEEKAIAKMYGFPTEKEDIEKVKNANSQAVDLLNKGEISHEDAKKYIDLNNKFTERSLENSKILPPSLGLTMQRVNYLDYSIQYLRMPEDVRDKLDSLAKEYMKALAKYYNIPYEKLTAQHAEDFKKGIENGTIPENELDKYTPYGYAFNSHKDLENIQRRRKELQSKLDGSETYQMKQDLIIEMYKEINLNVTKDNLIKNEGNDLNNYGIKILSSGGQVGYISLKAKDGGDAIHEFSTLVLQSGMQDIRDNHKGDIKAMEVFLGSFVADTKFVLENKDSGSNAVFNDINQDFSKLRALELYREGIKDGPLNEVLNAHIETMKEKVILSAMKDFNISKEEAEKMISQLTIADYEKYSSYGAFNAYMENRLEKQQNANEVVINSALTSANAVSKITPVSKNQKETEQEMLDRLVKEGMSLGEIKEKYPQLDKLVAKEHEAVALGKENANEQTKEINIENGDVFKV